MYASRDGHGVIVEMLLKKGANADAANEVCEMSTGYYPHCRLAELIWRVAHAKGLHFCKLE